MQTPGTPGPTSLCCSITLASIDTRVCLTARPPELTWAFRRQLGLVMLPGWFAYEGSGANVLCADTPSSQSHFPIPTQSQWQWFVPQGIFWVQGMLTTVGSFPF